MRLPTTEEIESGNSVLNSFVALQQTMPMNRAEMAQMFLVASRQPLAEQLIAMSVVLAEAVTRLAADGQP